MNLTMKFCRFQPLFVGDDKLNVKNDNVKRCKRWDLMFEKQSPISFRTQYVCLFLFQVALIPEKQDYYDARPVDRTQITVAVNFC